jgi:segregation and condensation protein A
MAYQVNLELFEGPLDLLLYLVKQNHLEISAIPLAKVTDQYLQYLEVMQALDLEVAGEFLVVAATLVQIKSRMLLPPDPERAQEEEEEDPTQELVDRLREYQRFKEAAELLGGMEKERFVQFSRPVPEIGVPVETQEYVEASLFDLLTAFSQFVEGGVSSDLVHEVMREEFTVEQKIKELRQLTAQRPQVRVSELFTQAKSKMEVVATFLATLELIRMKEVAVRQNNVFGEIVIVRISNAQVKAP